MRLEPFKVVAEVMATEHDDDGRVIGERHVANIVLYASQFDRLPAAISDVWPEVEAQAAAEVGGRVVP